MLTPGFLGQATAAGNLYSFGSSVTVLPNVQYFLYENGLIPTMGGTVYPGGVAFGAITSTSNFAPVALNQSAYFLATGTPVPEPTTVLFGAALTGVLLTRRHRRE